MTRIKFAALFLAAAFVFCLGGCSKAEPGRNSLPDEHDIVLTPNYNEGESEYEYPESGKSSSRMNFITSSAVTLSRTAKLSRQL